MKTSDGEAIKDGCHKQENVNGVDVEACFCDPFIKEKCNEGTKNAVSSSFLILSLAIFVNEIFSRVDAF